MAIYYVSRRRLVSSGIAQPEEIAMPSARARNDRHESFTVLNVLGNHRAGVFLDQSAQFKLTQGVFHLLVGRIQ